MVAIDNALHLVRVKKKTSFTYVSLESSCSHGDQVFPHPWWH